MLYLKIISQFIPDDECLLTLDSIRTTPCKKTAWMWWMFYALWYIRTPHQKKAWYHTLPVEKINITGPYVTQKAKNHATPCS